MAKKDNPTKEDIKEHFNGSYRLYKAWWRCGFDWPPYERTVTALKYKLGLMGKPEGLKKITDDDAAVAKLEAWCKKQPHRKKAGDLHFETNGEFSEFTNQSLARKLTIIFDGMFGKGCQGGPGDADASALALMQSARSGLGLSLEGKLTCLK